MEMSEELKLVDIDKLVPYARNARTHSPEQIKQIQASIREFGFVNPVLIDGKFNIIAGHGRILAAKAEGIDKVPCVFVEYLTDAQKKAYMLASSIVKELNAICPVKSNRSSSVQSGMAAFNGAGYGEVRSPYQHGLTAVLAETDFHDNPQVAQWIINCKDTIARAYVNALVNTFGIAKKQVPPVIPPPATPSQYYRVQVGAYSQKTNAEAMLAKIKAAGFDAIIKYD